MFEFRINYLEEGYHKKGDKPFFFPPPEIDNKIFGNLIEIEGRNGTGKTTLLNVLALALGYLDQEKELETKPALKHKLIQLQRNSSLEYFFRISYGEPTEIDLKIEREKGQNSKWWLNSKPTDLDNLNRKFDIVFLTEDDPKKVVSASIGKLRRYFHDLEKGTTSLQTELIKHLQAIDEFRDFKDKESGLIGEIENCRSLIKKKEKEFEGLSEKIKKLEKKNETKERLKLLSEKEKIIEDYEKLKKTFERLNTKKDSDIAHELFRERTKLGAINSEIKKIDRRIKQICDSLRIYGIPLDEKRLQRNDYTELNSLNEKTRPKKREETVKMQMIDELLGILNHYLDGEIVPIIKKTVADTRKELLKLKAQLASDRAFALIRTLNLTMKEKKKASTDFEKSQTKISELIRKNKELEDLDETQKAYLKAEEKYLALQVAQNEDITALLSQWKELSLIEGDLEEIEDQRHAVEVAMEAQKTLEVKYSERLELLKANSTGMPEHYKNEEKINKLYQTVFRLRERITQWMEILRNPEVVREQFEKEADRTGFGKNEYEHFVKAVGEYLGSQFEPIPFDYKQHNVKFFDIEKNVFITTEDRSIHIANLSQGQSKVTSLTGSFKKMDPNKKKIVLIDEISELDPQNLQDVKNTLKTKLEDGSLLLAILVRPSSEMIRIKKWDT